MTISEIRARFDEFCNIFQFEYKGGNCYFDPMSRRDKWVYDVVCGDDYEQMSFDNLDDVLNAPLFFGKSLTDICGEINIIAA